MFLAHICVCVCVCVLGKGAGGGGVLQHVYEQHSLCYLNAISVLFDIVP